jgi:membrane-associated phospholipid phosphatase
MGLQLTNDDLQLTIETKSGHPDFVRKSRFWLLLAFLLFQAPLWSEERDSSTTTQVAQQEPQFKLGEIAKNVWNDQKLIWSTPSRMNSRQWLTIAAPLAGVTAGLIATDEKAMTLLPNTPDQILWCGRVSDVGALYSLGGFSAGILIAGKLAKKNWLFQVGQGSAEALVNSVIVGYSIKYSTARERPTQNDGEGRFWKGGDSFPSGHSLDTWAVATAIARTRKCPKWIAIASYSVAGAVSLSRWGAEKHFPSDIVVGAVFGWFIGNHVARRPR